MCFEKNTRQRASLSSVKKTLGKEASLPSVKKNTRQRASLPSVKKKHSAKKLLCRVSKKNTRQRASLPSVFFFAECFCSALGKEALCRVPEKKHSAIHLALDKEPVSGCASS